MSDRYLVEGGVQVISAGEYLHCWINADLWKISSLIDSQPFSKLTDADRALNVHLAFSSACRLLQLLTHIYIYSFRQESIAETLIQTIVVETSVQTIVVQISVQTIAETLVQTRVEASVQTIAETLVQTRVEALVQTKAAGWLWLRGNVA